MTTKDIQVMLAGGKSVDDLVAEFTKAVNDYSAEQEKNRVQTRKENKARTIATALDDYFKEFYPEIMQDTEDDTSAAEVVELLDGCAKLMLEFKKLDQATFPLRQDLKNDKDIINSFFRQNGIH